LEQSSPSPVIDPRYFVHVLIELQVAIRKVGFYSLSHGSVVTVLDSLERQFNALFEFAGTVTFGITRHELLYQGNSLSGSNPVIRELAAGLNHLGLAWMTFSKGLTRAEILKFLRFLLEARGQSPDQREQVLSRFHQEVPSVRLQFIRFGGALKEAEGIGEAEGRKKGQQEGRKFWRDLVRQLMEETPEAKQVLPANSEEKTGPDQLAGLINHICQTGGKSSQSYERAIVKYLNNRAKNDALTVDQRINLNRELSDVLSKLAPDVREQIFRISVEEAQEGDSAMEELIEFLPEPALLEILKHIQVSNQNISAPMLGLLNKFTDISGKNPNVWEALSSKLSNHRELFEELLTNRSNRPYYPEAYRSFLDQDLSHQQSTQGSARIPELSDIEPAAVNHHLALIILELLDGPIRSQSECRALTKHLSRLLADGLGERTDSILQDALVILFEKLRSADQENLSFIQKEIKEFINPEVLTRLIRAPSADREQLVGDLFGQLRAVAGAEYVLMLLDLLETEEKLSVRKRLLGLLTQFGPSVIPLAVLRLKDSKWYVARNMVVLLKDLHAKEALPEIARCLERDSPKLRLAALQALETLGRGTESYYHGLSIALRDQDESVFRKAISMILADRDPRAAALIKMQIQSANRMRTDTQLIAVLEMIRKSGARELVPLLLNLRRRLRFRFWQWNRNRFVDKALKNTIRDLQRRGES